MIKLRIQKISKNELAVTTAREEETELLGVLIAAVLEPGTVAGLFGKLGAGKSVIARAIARGLGIEENITSPTFVIMNCYERTNPRSAPFYHFDLYRKPSAGEFEELGFAEILRGDGVCVVEWAENLPGGPTGCEVGIHIHTSTGDENIREITITASEKKIVRLANELKKGAGAN